MKRMNEKRLFEEFENVRARVKNKITENEIMDEIRNYRKAH